MFEPRTYRNHSISNLVTFEVHYKDTDLFVAAERDVSVLIDALAQQYRRYIETFIAHDPLFEISFKPVAVPLTAPAIVQNMARYTALVGVGPMASVAGAIAEYIGRAVIAEQDMELLIENGGDIFLYTKRERTVGLYTRSEKFGEQLSISIPPSKNPYGICTSSRTMGPSVSLGNTDSVTIISASATLSDAAATAVGNIVHTKSDISKGLDLAKTIEGITGVLIICENTLGVWGDVQLTN